VRRRNRSASIWQWMCSVDREPAISYGIPPYRLVPTYAAAGWERTSALRKTLFPCSIECGIKPCDPTVAGSSPAGSRSRSGRRSANTGAPASARAQPTWRSAGCLARLVRYAARTAAAAFLSPYCWCPVSDKTNRTNRHPPAATSARQKNATLVPQCSVTNPAMAVLNVAPAVIAKPTSPIARLNRPPRSATTNGTITPTVDALIPSSTWQVTIEAALPLIANTRQRTASATKPASRTSLRPRA
jgi:hypothetical protein